MTPSRPSANGAPAIDGERRHHLRIAFRSPAQLSVTGSAIAVSVLDISLKGALVRLPADAALYTGVTGQLRVPLDDTSGLISMDVRVTHLDNGSAGLACLLIDLDSVTHLRRLVELNLGDATLLERELSALVAE